MEHKNQDDASEDKGIPQNEEKLNANVSSQDSSKAKTDIDSAKRNKLSFYLKKVNLKWAIPFLMLACFSFYQYLSNQQTEVAHQEQLEKIRTQYESNIRTQLLNNSKKQLTLMMKSLVWAVRSSMIRKNNDEIAQYFYEMVQEEGVYEVLLIDNKDKITVSTNKKNELKKFSSIYPQVDLGVHSISFVNNENNFQLLAPIMSLDQKVGTLFIEMKSEIPPPFADTSTSTDSL